MKRTLNLLPAAEAKPLASGKLLTALAVATAIYAATLLGVWLVNYNEASKLDSTIEDLSGRKLKLQQYLAVSAAPLGAQTANPEIMEMMRSTPPWDAVLAELSLIVPGEVWLEVIESSDAKHLRLKGYSSSQTDVARLIDKLESSRYFGNVKIVFAQKGDKATTFELKAEMIWT